MVRSLESRLSVAQCVSLVGKIDENLDVVATLSRQASLEGAALILFPEAHVTGYSYRNLPTLVRATAETRNGRIVRRLSEIASDCNLTVCCGMFEREGPHFYNTLVVASPDGKIDGQRKGVLAGGEVEILTAEPHRKGFDCCGFRFGALVCADSALKDYDEQFAELDVSLVLHSSAGRVIQQTPPCADKERKLSDDAFQNGQRLARSLDVSYAVANPIGFSLEDEYPGNSWIIRPDGKCVRGSVDPSPRNASPSVLTLDLPGHPSVKNKLSRLAKPLIPAALAFLLGLTSTMGSLPVQNLSSPAPAALWSTINSQVEASGAADESVLSWTLNEGQNAELALKPETPLFSQLRDYDRLEFEFRVQSGRLDSLEFRALGHVSGPRRNKLHQWGLAVLTTPPGVWHSRQIDLARPNWFPWDNPDGTPPQFGFGALAVAPNTVVEFRKLRLIAAPLRVKPFFETPVTWPIRSTESDGNTAYSFEVPVQNISGKPAEIQAQLESTHDAFHVTCEPASVPAKNGETVVFRVRATISQAAIAATPELFSEELRITFRTRDDPSASTTFPMVLTRPLTSGTGKSFILPAGDAKFLRDTYATGDAKAIKELGIDKILADADAFLAIRLDQIPGGHGRVENNWPVVPGSNPPRRYQIGTTMPEIVDSETGLREVGTPLANRVWKEYLGTSGRAPESLGLAYLITGDEKYAAKAVELMELYATQYASLPWGSVFEAPWGNGPAILSASRVSTNSGYGSNWLFRFHARMLGLINESPSLTPEARQRILAGFVLPYATELMKFSGGISNMTDITNTNLLILGLVFDDANMVRFALLTDPGLISRLADIDEDGFSSEGRPANYHLAAMDEFLPAMAYLHNSGLKVSFPRDRLLAAVKMLYERATSWGLIPNSGDCGRGGMIVSKSTQAEALLPIFPDVPWLLDISKNQTLLSKARHMALARQPLNNGHLQLINTEPRLFKTAGMAILRSGESSNQIMATLDYGRNPMHAHLDRNQITLSAFGKVFTHGPGTLYNAGTGGIKLSDDPKLRSFCGAGSLGQNVILVDQLNQQRAIGKLVASDTSADKQFVTARVEGIAPGVGHTRTLALRDGLVIVMDRIDSAEDHTYDFVYHNFGTLSPGPGWVGSPVETPLGTTANYENLIDPVRLSGQGPVRLTWNLTGQVKPPVGAPDSNKAGAVSDPVHLALWHLASPGAEFFTATTGMNNPNTSEVPGPAPSLISRFRGKAAEYVTVLEPYRDKPTVTGLTGDADRFTILRGDESLTLSRDDFKL